MISSNVQIRNTYLMMQNIPNYNKLVILDSTSLTINEEQSIKRFIMNAISSYTNYMDISRNISDSMNDSFNGKWIAIVGEREKYNCYGIAAKCFAANIGPYKIVVRSTE